MQSVQARKEAKLKAGLTMVWDKFWTNSCSVELFRTLKMVYLTFSSSYMSLP